MDFILFVKSWGFIIVLSQTFTCLFICFLGIKKAQSEYEEGITFICTLFSVYTLASNSFLAGLLTTIKILIK